MASRILKRYGLENGARALIYTGLLLIFISWLVGGYYFAHVGKGALLITPVVFSAVTALLLIVIRYRYILFERYPYLMNLPSIFYRIGKRGGDKQSIAFSMIFTVHALVVAVIGFMSLLLTISIGFSVHNRIASPFLYLYFGTAIVLVISVLLLYRRIYIKFVE